jgi:hypothetical protein
VSVLLRVLRVGTRHLTRSRRLGLAKQIRETGSGAGSGRFKFPEQSRDFFPGGKPTAKLYSTASPSSSPLLKPFLPRSQKDIHRDVEPVVPAKPSWSGRCTGFVVDSRSLPRRISKAIQPSVADLTRLGSKLASSGPKRTFLEWLATTPIQLHYGTYIEQVCNLYLISLRIIQFNPAPSICACT